MLINRWDNFIEEKLLETFLNEAVLYLSPRLRNLLRSIDSPIANDILDKETKEVKPEFTFIDLVDGQSQYFSFITTANALRRQPSIKSIIEPPTKSIQTKATKLYLSDRTYDQPHWRESRNEIKVGKFAARVTDGKYSDASIEEFVTKFKSKIDTNLDFKILEGSDISPCYYVDSYYDLRGQLGKSCMNDCDFFSLYEKNPEVCRILCVYLDGKIVGRALLWKPFYKRCLGKDLDFEWFMDRQYTNEDSVTIRMQEYAKSNGWAYKNTTMNFTRISYKDNILDVTMRVQLGDYTYETFPYVDTFRRYDPKAHILHNDDDNIPNMYLLSETSGDHIDTNDISTVWSDYLEIDVPEQDAIWSDYLQSWLVYSDCVNCSVMFDNEIINDYIPKTHPDLVKDPITDEYMHISLAVYSPIYDGYINMDTAITAINFIDNESLECNPIDNTDGYRYYASSYDRIYKNGRMVQKYISLDTFSDTKWLNFLEKNVPNWEEHINDSNYISTELLVNEGISDIYIPKAMAVECYDIGNNIRMSKLDAALLGMSIVQGTKVVIDMVTYFSDLGDKIASSIEDRCDELIDKRKEGEHPPIEDYIVRTYNKSLIAFLSTYKETLDFYTTL